MIIKGKSRGGPRQLGPYLLRKGKNESVRLFELKSPHATLTPTFVDWQLLAGGTKGTLGLYHAQINPAAGYTMTPEQWTRAVDVLEEKLGLAGQPRAVVLHVKDGREHAHVVWQRTEIETMTLISDAWNYRAHEQASQQLEQEFGHEHVPGKHAKRNRDKQKEPPKAELSITEAQQAERSGLDPTERKAAVTALFGQSDTGQAFKTALEQHGYILAQGDRRDFVIVDTAGHIHSLGRQIKDEDGKQIRAKELREFMSDIDRAHLPTPEQAKAMQLAAAQEKQPAPAPDAPKPAEPAPVVSREEIAALEEALTKRHAFDAGRLVQSQQIETQYITETIDGRQRDALAEFDRQQQEARAQHAAEIADQRTGIAAFIHAMKLRFNPALAAEEAKQRREAELHFERRLAKEREGEIALLKTQKQEQLETLAERQAQERENHGKRYDHELERHIRELGDAKRIEVEMQDVQRQLEERQRGRDGPEPPTWVR